MAFHPGQAVWVAFPGLRVPAVIVEVGAGEVEVREEGCQETEWVSMAWCSRRG